MNNLYWNIGIWAIFIQAIIFWAIIIWAIIIWAITIRAIIIWTIIIRTNNQLRLWRIWAKGLNVDVTDGCWTFSSNLQLHINQKREIKSKKMRINKISNCKDEKNIWHCMLDDFPRKFNDCQDSSKNDNNVLPKIIFLKGKNFEFKCRVFCNRTVFFTLNVS